MNICILTNSEDAADGWGRYSRQVIDGLRADGHSVVVLTEQGGPHPVLSRGFRILWACVRVVPFVWRCDVVHALDVYPYGIIAWIATRLVPRPLFISGIGTYSVAPLLRNWTAWLARTACMSAYRVVAISRYTAQRMREVVPNARIDVVTPGLESVPAMQARQHVTHTILSVGALKKRKGYHIAIQAFAEAKKSIPTLTYTIVGDQRDTVYFETLRQLARQYSVESALIFRQHLSEEVLHAEYQNAGVFLLPSVNVGNHFEGFGLVFLEAAAQGLPVIGTTGNGIADAVGEGNGILVEQNDVSSLARAIVAVLNDEQQYAAMSASSLAWAKQHPASHMVQAYEKIYAEALNRHA